MYFSDTSNLSMNSAKSRFFSILNHIEEVIIVSMFALMVIIIFVQVIMRKAGNSLSWSEELGKFLFVWISWMGISLGQREGEHIKITMLTDRLPFRLAQIVNIISDIVVIIICAVIFYYGVELVVAQGQCALCWHQDQHLLGLLGGGAGLRTDDSPHTGEHQALCPHPHQWQITR